MYPGPMLTRYSCDHVGRDNDAEHAKAKAFIRVAEVRDEKVEEKTKPCPDCTGR